VDLFLKAFSHNVHKVKLANVNSEDSYQKWTIVKPIWKLGTALQRFQRLSYLKCSCICVLCLVVPAFVVYVYIIDEYDCFDLAPLGR